MTDIELHPDFAPAPTTLFASNDPAQIVAQAARIADVIKPLIKERNLYKHIGNSDHVYIDAWTLAGTLLGVFATTVRTWMIGDDEGYGACVEARTMAGAVVGRAEAVVTRAEEKWATKEPFQLLSMAQTRASSKALRMPLGFVMKLAGYETTPAEEMEAAAARGETVTGGKGVRPGWRDMAEQQRAHADLGALIDEHDLRKWVAEWCDSKSYVRPLAKGQFNQLSRAIQREIEDRAKTAGVAPSPPVGAAPATDASVTGQDPPGPPNTEAPTSPGATSPGDGTAGRGRSRRGAPGNAVTESESSPAAPADDATEQAEFEQTIADDTGKWKR